MTDRNIVLVGFMGTGKSAAGRIVAARLKREFVDMDSVIEARADKTISSIFAEDGEPHFRRMEHDVAAELSQRTGLVIACGGGVVLNPENIRNLERGGMLICLKASPDVILSRVSADNQRPLLAGDDKARRILSILESRRELYDAIPHSIDTSAMSAEMVAERIIELSTRS